jgi:hypothetical protein
MGPRCQNAAQSARHASCCGGNVPLCTWSCTADRCTLEGGPDGWSSHAPPMPSEQSSLGGSLSVTAQGCKLPLALIHVDAAHLGLDRDVHRTRGDRVALYVMACTTGNLCAGLRLVARPWARAKKRPFMTFASNMVSPSPARWLGCGCSRPERSQDIITEDNPKIYLQFGKFVPKSQRERA